MPAAPVLKFGPSTFQNFVPSIVENFVPSTVQSSSQITKGKHVLLIQRSIISSFSVHSRLAHEEASRRPQAIEGLGEQGAALHEEAHQQGERATRGGAQREGGANPTVSRDQLEIFEN